MAFRHVNRPAGVPESRHVFRDQVSNKDWHAEVEWRDGQAGEGTVVVVQVMEPDGTIHEGTISHTFTEAELANPEFDADDKIQELILERIERSERIQMSKASLAAARGKWKGKGNHGDV